MNTISRYVARNFLSSYLILMAVGIGLWCVTSLLANIDEFIGDGTLSLGQMLWSIADYYLYNLPLYFSQLSDAIMTIAAAFTLGYMLRQNEMTALAAAGYPLRRVATPILLLSLLIVGLGAADREWLIPRLATKIARTFQDLRGERTEGIHCARDARNAELTAARFEPKTGSLYRVFIVERDASGRAGDLIEADAAHYDEPRKVWRLERGRRRPMDAGGGPTRPVLIDEYPFQLTPEELALRRNSQWADLMSVQQMLRLLQSPNLASRPALVMSLHTRATQPLTQMILLLLAIPFFLSRQPESVLAVGGRALLVAGTFYAVVFVLQTIAQDETTAAAVAWAPIILFAPLALLLFANLRT